METFCPEYLEQQRKAHSHELDEELIADTKDRITEANLSGRRHLRLSYKTTERWESTVNYFRGQGFSVTSFGNDFTRDYDSNGDEIFIFQFTW